MAKNNALNKVLVSVAFLLVMITAGSFNTIVALTLAGMLVYFSTIGENDNAVSVLDAFYLLLANGVIRLVIGGIYDIIRQIIVWADGNPYKAFTDIFNILGFVITICFVAIAFIAYLSKNKGSILFNGMARKSLGFAQKNFYPAQQQQMNGWQCDCGRVNEGGFCSSCGKPKK